MIELLWQIDHCFALLGAQMRGFSLIDEPRWWAWVEKYYPRSSARVIIGRIQDYERGGCLEKIGMVKG